MSSYAWPPSEISSSDAVISLNGLTGAINLIGGSNIEISLPGNDIMITALASGGGNEIQYNSGEGNFAGNANLTWDGSTLFATNLSTLNSMGGIGTQQLNLPSQGTSNILWGANSHNVTWLIGSDMGTDQTWTWAGNGPGINGGVFMMDSSNHQSFLALTTASNDYLGGDGTFHSIPTFSNPGLSTVLGVSADAGAQGITNVGVIVPNNDNTIDFGGSSNRFRNAFIVNFFDNQSVSGLTILDSDRTLNTTTAAVAALAWGNPSFLNIYSGANASPPGDTTTPVAWLDVQIAGGNLYKIALYQ